MDILCLLVICCVVICAVGCLRERRISALPGNSNQIDQIQTDVADLKKNVNDMKEYVADLYIQQNSPK